MAGGVDNKIMERPIEYYNKPRELFCKINSTNGVLVLLLILQYSEGQIVERSQIIFFYCKLIKADTFLTAR